MYIITRRSVQDISFLNKKAKQPNFVTFDMYHLLGVSIINFSIFSVMRFKKLKGFL